MGSFNFSFSAQLRKAFLSYRVGFACILLGGGLLLTVGISLSQGAVALSFAQLWQALLHQGDPINQTILWDLRLPRTMAALIVGAALGMSGALLQGMLRNGLADPFLLGISAGAGLVALLGGCLLARSVNILNLGDDLAVGLGFSLMRSRLLIGGVATLLAAGAVSVGGLIGFLGLVVPHAVRLLVGTDYRWVLPLSAVGGAFVLTFADMLSRLGAVELPVGAVTALLGSPLFVWLLSRRSAASRSL